MDLVAGDTENRGKLTVETGLCGKLKIVVKVGNTAARLSEELAARADGLDYPDEALGGTLADSLAVCILSVFFDRYRYFFNFCETGNKRLGFIP